MLLLESTRLFVSGAAAPDAEPADLDLALRLGGGGGEVGECVGLVLVGGDMPATAALSALLRRLRGRRLRRSLRLRLLHLVAHRLRHALDALHRLRITLSLRHRERRASASHTARDAPPSTRDGVPSPADHARTIPRERRARRLHANEHARGGGRETARSAPSRARATMRPTRLPSPAPSRSARRRGRAGDLSSRLVEIVDGCTRFSHIGGRRGTSPLVQDPESHPRPPARVTKNRMCTGYTFSEKFPFFETARRAKMKVSFQEARGMTFVFPLGGFETAVARPTSRFERVVDRRRGHYDLAPTAAARSRARREWVIRARRTYRVRARSTHGRAGAGHRR